MPISKNAVVLVVISFLVVILVYSSVAKHDVYARQKVYGLKNLQCNTKPFNSSFDTRTCCWDQYDANTGQAQGRFCQECTMTKDGYVWTCENPICQTTCSQQVGTVNPPSSLVPGLPGRLGNAQPSSTLSPPSNETHVNNLPGNIGTMQPTFTPPSNAIPPPSALQSPTKQQTLTTTCPNGLLSDANGNCPPTSKDNQQGGSASDNNNNPPSGHHHKGSNNQPTQTGGGGGQELTATKKHKGSKTDQGTITQPPS